ncbi:MAG TPA: hypothetical protein K8V84_14535 [Nocardiopsis listeri]|uniref:hypothetical protein n=1 Tax=Nocardiopsis listeri TaxID=53440 RepID=UPI001D8206EF|nr:hypothetical protein [Nocardiopsis listeri]HJE59704.1 hypothetical protein [Nocardiopsis listeri]
MSAALTDLGHLIEDLLLDSGDEPVFVALIAAYALALLALAGPHLALCAVVGVALVADQVEADDEWARLALHTTEDRCQ